MKKQFLLAVVALNVLFGSNPSQAQWQLNGNAGTVSTNFIGTTDNVSLKFKTKNLNRMIILSGGNVGIGTTAPGYKLQVIGTGRFEDGVKIGGFGVVNVDAPGIVAGRLKIDSAGYVGIGTPTPFTNFVVNSGTNASSDRGVWSAQYSGGNLGAVFGGRRSRGTETTPLPVGPADYGVALLSQNYDGINYILNGSLGYRITGNATANNIPGEWYIAASDDHDFNPYNSNHVRMVVQSTGNVGIGTTSPTSMLSVNGTADKPGGGSWAVFSDSRLKKEVTFYEDGLSTLLKISPVKYHYNELSGCDTKPEYVGVIAQELQEVAPYMVDNFEKDGKEYLKVDNSAMTYMLINSIKEQQKQIESKDAKVADMQNQINELKSIVNSCCEASAAASIRKITSTIDLNESKLIQNQPNPFNHITIIRYALSGEYSSGIITVRDLSGNIIKSIAVSNTDKGQITINANELAQGTYTYTLIVNNQSIDTKLMVITK